MMVMTIFEDRLDFCLLMIVELLKSNGEDEIEIQGAKYKIKHIAPQFHNYVKKIILKDEESSEKILRFLADSYFFVTGMSDNQPEFERP